MLFTWSLSNLVMLKQDVFVTAGAYDAHVVQISTTHCADIMPFFLEGGWEGPFSWRGWEWEININKRNHQGSNQPKSLNLNLSFMNFLRDLWSTGESFKLVLALCFLWSNWFCFEGSLFNCQILEFDWGQVCYKQGPSLGSLRTWENWEIGREETLHFKKWKYHNYLDGDFKCFLFSSLLGEDYHFDYCT